MPGEFVERAALTLVLSSFLSIVWLCYVIIVNRRFLRKFAV